MVTTLGSMQVEGVTAVAHWCSLTFRSTVCNDKEATSGGGGARGVHAMKHDDLASTRTCWACEAFLRW